MRWRLRTQLIFVVLVAGLPSVAVLVTDTVQDQERAEAAAEADAEAAAGHALAAQQRIIDRAEGTLAALAALEPVRHGDGADCAQVLRDVWTRETRFTNLAVVTDDLRFACTSAPDDAQPGPDVTAMTQAEWDALAADPHFRVGAMREGPFLGVPLLPMTYPVRDNGSLERVVSAGVALGSLQSDLESLAVQTGAHVLLVDADGNVLAAAPDPRGWAGESVQNAFTEAVAGGDPFTADPTGQDLLYHVVPLEAGTTDTPIYAVAGVPEPTVNIWTPNRVLAGVGAITALVAVTYLGVDRTVQEPSQRLQEATRRFMAGDLDHRVDTRRMPRELADAGEALNLMAPQLSLAQRGLERLVEERTRELERSNRDLEDFAYAASHDLRQPVRSITGYLDLVQLRAEDLDDESRAYLARAHQATMRMQDLIDGLLTYSRVTTQRGEAQDVDLDAEVRDVLDDLSRHLEERGADVEVEGVLPHAHATPAQARLVFQNLVSNAVKFVPDDRTPVIRIRGRVEHRQAVVEVDDNGIGIDAKYADRVFGMFQRLHPRDSYPGHGIGLAIVKRIVESHGGSVSFEEAPGGGTRFTVRLPLPGNRP